MSANKQEIEDYKEFLQDMEQDKPASVVIDGNPNHFTEQIDWCDKALKRIDKSLKVITFSQHTNGYYVCSEPNDNAGQYVTIEAHNADLELIRADYSNTIDELCDYAWGRVYGEGKTDWEYPVQAIRHLVTFCDEKDAEIKKLKGEIDQMIEDNRQHGLYQMRLAVEEIKRNGQSRVVCSSPLSVGETLQEAMIDGDITKSTFARKLETSRTQIERIISGSGNPTLNTIIEAAKALGLRTEIVFYKE